MNLQNYVNARNETEIQKTYFLNLLRDRLEQLVKEKNPCKSVVGMSMLKVINFSDISTTWNFFPRESKLKIQVECVLEVLELSNDLELTINNMITYKNCSNRRKGSGGLGINYFMKIPEEILKVLRDSI